VVLLLASPLTYIGGENTSVEFPQDEKTLGFLCLVLVGATVSFCDYDTYDILFL